MGAVPSRRAEAAVTTASADPDVPEVQPGPVDVSRPVLLWTWDPRGGHKVVQGAAASFAFGCSAFAAIALIAPLNSLYVLPAAVIALAVVGLRLVRTLRARVVLRPDGVQLRGFWTHLYSWDSLRSITLIEGRVEITPNGWVRPLAIPRDRSAEAYAVLIRWHRQLATAPLPQGQAPVATR